MNLHKARKSIREGINEDKINIHWFLIFGASLVTQTVKRLPAMRETRLDSWVGKIPWRRKWQSTPALLPGKSHGQRSLIGYSPWGHKESDRTERLHFHFLILIDLKDNWLIKARIVITYWIISTWISKMNHSNVPGDGRGKL